MDKAHEVSNVSLAGSTIQMTVDGKSYKIDLASLSSRLAQATNTQRANVEVPPSGYGLHWPEIDEDLSIDRLIGVKHEPPSVTTRS